MLPGKLAQVFYARCAAALLIAGSGGSRSVGVRVLVMVRLVRRVRAMFGGHAAPVIRAFLLPG